MICTTFARDDRPQGTREEMTWEELLECFAEPEPANVPKSELPLWSPAAFRDDYRKGTNVEAVYALTFDVDKVPVPDEAAIRAGVPWRAAAYSSSSATRAAPRWRLVIDISRPLTADEYARVWSTVAGVLRFPVGGESKDPSRAWYMPRVGADGHYVHFVIDGAPLDVDAVLADAPPAAAPATVAAPSAARGVTSRRLVAAAALGAAWPPSGDRMPARLALLGACYHEGWPREDAAAFSKAVHAHVANRGDVTDEVIEADARGTYGRGAADQPVAGWSKLGEYVGADVVDSTRRLLSFDALGPRQQAQILKSQKSEIVEEINTDKSFVGVSGEDLARPLPPLEYLVKHFGIAKGRPTLLAGYGGLGKTIIVQALALHMAGGVGHCWGLPVKAGQIWHFDYEMTLDPLVRRYQRLAYGHGISLPSCALQVCSMPEIYLSDDEAEDALVRAVEGSLMGIVDNLAAATATSQTGENESGIRRYLDRLSRVTARTGCQFLVLAHERKGAKADGDSSPLQRVRGSSAITDACGSVLSITVAPDTGILTISQNKSSLRQSGGDVALRLEDVDDRVRMPDDDPAGLRVVRVGEVEVQAQTAAADAEREAARVAQDRKLVEEYKPRVLDVMRQYQRDTAGITPTELRKLVSGKNSIKDTAITELSVSGQLLKVNGKLFLP